jgi:CheY-like chemotaxis protein
MRNGSYATGDEALAAVRAARLAGDPYDVVIADYQMPGMDGATLAKAIKSDPESSSVVFILLTSVGHWRELKNLEGASVDACLIKPFRQSKLKDTLAAAWAQKHAARTDRAERDFRPGTRSLTELEGHLENAGPGAAIRVLLVEDNAVNQKVAQMILGKMGIRADAAGDGREGVEMLKLLPYDIVFMDCQMPVMNGYDAVREVRSSAGPNQHVPIVAMTADAMHENRERCLDAGMDDFIAKPARQPDFLRALKRWLPHGGDIGVSEVAAAPQVLH